MVERIEKVPCEQPPGEEGEKEALSGHLIHLRSVHFTLLLACIVILAAVYLSLQERRVDAATEQLGSFVSAFSPEAAGGWESAIRDLAWEAFETPALSTRPSLEIPQDTNFTTWLPALSVESTPQTEDVIKLVEEKRLISSSGNYLEFVLDLVLLSLPNRSVVLSNSGTRRANDCLGRLQSETPRRVRELRRFWQNLGGLQAVALTDSRLQGTFQLFIDLIDRRSQNERAYPIHQAAIPLAPKPDTVNDAYLDDVLGVEFIEMRPCIVEPGSAVSEALLRERIGLVGIQRSLLYFVGELRLSPLLADRTPLSLRFLLVPEGINVQSFDGRRAMADLLGGRPGDGSFNTAFPELASVGRREVLIDERAGVLAQENSELSERRKALSGLELLQFDMMNTDVPLPPRPEDRIDLFGAKIQVEDIVLWGGLALLGVQFYLLLHLNGFLEFSAKARCGILRAPWIGVYRDPVARTATLLTTSVIPFTICAYLAYRIVGREREPAFEIVTLLVAGLSLVVAVATVHQFRKIWSKT